MSDKMRESLSALMDNEANELEVERVLANIGEDEQLRQAWMRYHVARDATSGGVDPALTRLDISRGVQAAIAQQGGARVAAPGLRERLGRPLASFAIAASVAAVMVVGSQQVLQVGGTDPIGEPAVAARDIVPPQPVIDITGAATGYTAALNIRNEAPVLQEATPNAYRNLARMRLGRYMQEHAEQAALNSPQGMVPFARVPRIEE